MRKGDWIQTYTGKKFYPLDPRPEDVCLLDIAHALSLTCRYNGHCNVFYSVAEHSFRMSVADIPGCPKWKLLHDAAEAYVSDVPRPIKPMLSEYRDLENAVMKVIAHKYDLRECDQGLIKAADMVMLATEKRDVVNASPPWSLHLPAPLPDKINPMRPQVAEWLFLRRAVRLGIYD